MKQLSVNRALQLCGVIWLLIGFILFRKGILFAANLAAQSEPASSSRLFSFLVGLFSSTEWAAAAIMATGMIVGLLKARHVLSKVVLRNTQRLASLREISLLSLFDRRFLLLMAAMMGIGFSINKFELPIDLRAFIDLAVGVALIQGANAYFRYARASSMS